MRGFAPSHMWFLVLSLGVLPNLAAGMTIYRFGGHGLPLPSEVGAPGVEFRQMDWSDVDPLAGGESTRVHTDNNGIGPLVYDPHTNIAPQLVQLDAPGRHGSLFDGERSTTWTARGYRCEGGGAALTTGPSSPGWSSAG